MLVAPFPELGYRKRKKCLAAAFISLCFLTVHHDFLVMMDCSPGTISPHKPPFS